MHAVVPHYPEAIELLRSLSSADGIRASASRTTNYAAVFTRDAVMAGVAGLLVEDAAVTDGLLRTLEHLRALQGREGQIASNYELRADGATRVSFGTLAPRIDAATWYLIGLGLGVRAGIVDAEPFRESAHAVVRLLDALEYNGRHLVYVPPGGNWADEYVYDGYVLYDQVLRAWALRLLSPVYERAWSEKARSIEQVIEINYWPDGGEGLSLHSPIVRTLVDPRCAHPVASFSPVRSWDMFDLAASSLLAVSGVAPRLAAGALDFVVDRFLTRSELPPAFHPVIDEDHPDWPALSRYHLFEFRNRPHEYHNGGVWPIWLGWLALGLARAQREEDLGRLLELCGARLSARADFRFHEFLHGASGQPGGTTGMAYSATGVVFLHAARRPDRLRTVFPMGGGARIELQEHYFTLAASLRARLLGDFGLRAAARAVIGVAGESGSGKSVTAECLAAELEKEGIASVVLHQDDYFHLPPRANHANRLRDLHNVGPQEVNLELLRSTIAAFRAGASEVIAPLVDYPSDRMLTQRHDFRTTRVLIVEGTYALMLADLDVRIFLSATHGETQERRRLRNRDLDDPVIDRVLAIEHDIIAPQAGLADLVIDRDFHIVESRQRRSPEGIA